DRSACRIAGPGCWSRRSMMRCAHPRWQRRRAGAEAAARTSPQSASRWWGSIALSRHTPVARRVGSSAGSESLSATPRPTERLRLGAIAVVLLSLVASSADARDVTDSAGRKVAVPDQIERVIAAGPPASVLVTMLAPEKLIGW